MSKWLRIHQVSSDMLPAVSIFPAAVGEAVLWLCGWGDGHPVHIPHGNPANQDGHLWREAGPDRLLLSNLAPTGHLGLLSGDFPEHKKNRMNR